MAPAFDEILPDVLRLLADRAGFDAQALGDAGLAHAVGRRLAASRAASPRAYLGRLAADPAEFQELLELLVVPETWFFRDALAFRSLARWLEAERGRDRGPTRVLSVGCSTGEEVYSLAIALRAAGLEPPHCALLGIDVCRQSLRLAEEGVFAARSFREPDETIAELRTRWCQPAGESWKVRDELRGGREFRWANLAAAEFLTGEPPFQVIFCRNVLIYFHAAARRTAVGHLRRLLSPDGILVSAPAEARVFSDAGFRSLGSACPFAFHHATDDPMPLTRSLPAAGVPVARRPVARRSTLSPVPPASPRGPARVEFSAEAVLAAARVAADDGRLDEADELCGQVLARDPACAAAHYLRGVVCQARGELADAQRSLEKALYLDPKHYQALVQMMLLAQQHGDHRAAANFRRRAEEALALEAS